MFFITPPGELCLSQEYTKSKAFVLKKRTGYSLLLEVFFLIAIVFSVYLIIALFTFDSADPSWTQTAWHDLIHNAGGRIGAWIADILFFCCGVIAYFIPIVGLLFCWIFAQQYYQERRIDYFTLALKVIGAVALFLSSCALVAMNADDMHYFSSGGVLGSLLSGFMINQFNHIGATLLFLSIWGAGFSLFTGWPWLLIVEKIGWGTFYLFNLLRCLCQHWKKSAIKDPLPERKNKSSHFSYNQLNIIHDKNELCTVYPQIIPEEHELQLDKQIEISNDSILTNKQPNVDDVDPSYLSSGAIQKKIEPLYSTLMPNVTENNYTTSPSITLSNDHKLVEDKAHDANNVSFEQVTTYTEKTSSIFNNTNDKSEINEPYNVATSNKINALNKEAVTPKETAAHQENVTHNNAPKRYNKEKRKVHQMLPRPNPVRIPTRRELLSYGIRLPSQRQQEVEIRKQERSEDRITFDELATSSINYYENGDHHCYDKKLTTETAFNLDTHEDSEMALDVIANPYQGEAKEVIFDKTDNFYQDHDAFLSVTRSNQHHNMMPRDDIEEVKVQEKPYNQPLHDLYVSHTFCDDSQKLKSVSRDRDYDINEGLIHPFLMRNDPSLPKPTTPLPTLDLLTPPPASKMPINMGALQRQGELLEERLMDYRVNAKVVGIHPGPVITLFELDLAPGVKVARISNLARDLARSLSTTAVRVVEILPGRPYVGLELPNIHRQTVYLREVLDCEQFREINSPLAIVLGQNISGKPVIADLAKMPHVLVAGTTGSGKSVGVNAMIISMLYKATPDDVRFIMIDPKMLELSVYEGIPHLLTEVVTDMKDASNALNWCVGEMERRYKLMSALGVRNLSGYNERIAQAEQMGRPVPDPFWKPGMTMDDFPPHLEKLPYIVVIVDEFADLMMAVGKKVEELIARLAQKARAAGIHLVLATQRPSVDVITGLIKANIPTRIAFTVSSKIDSRTILDQGGAESLLGMGDMLYLPASSSIPMRVHGAFVRDEEVHAVAQDWKARGKPQYIESITATVEDSSTGNNSDNQDDLDPLYDSAVAFVIEKRKASISAVQRQFRIGYNRAARIVEQMEADGTVSPPGHNGNREVLAPPPFE